MTTPFDFPIIRIKYHDDIHLLGRLVAPARAVVLVLDKSGFAVKDEEPRELPMASLPVFLFQLVERGYSVSEDAEYRDGDGYLIGARSIIAVNKDGMDGLADRFGRPVFVEQVK